MALDIKTLVSDKPLSAEVEFRDGIFLTLNYVSRSALQQLYKNCTTLKYDRPTHQRTPQVDPKKFSAEFCKLAVKGWRGVTPAALASLMPIDLSNVSEQQRKEELPFTQETLLFIVERAYELDNFLQDTAVDAKIFNPAMEGELGNSENSQSGS